MSAHTPGPWRFIAKLSGSENHKGFGIYEGDRGYIGEVSPRCYSDGNASVEGTANARLIAAAPELLEALIEAEPMLAQLLRFLNENLPNGAGMPALEKARAAIKKATES